MSEFVSNLRTHTVSIWIRHRKEPENKELKGKEKQGQNKRSVEKDSLNIMTYFVSETTSTSGLAAMRVSESPTVGLSIATSPLVELTTWTDPWRSLGVNPPTPRFLRSYCPRLLLSSFEYHGDVGVMGSRDEFLLAFAVRTSPPFDDDDSCN
jgi:hypothetical protein